MSASDAELLRKTARAHKRVVHAGSIKRDLLHMPSSIPPSLSVSPSIPEGRSSHGAGRVGQLAQTLLGQHLWARGLWGCKRWQREGWSLDEYVNGWLSARQTMTFVWPKVHRSADRSGFQPSF